MFTKRHGPPGSHPPHSPPIWWMARAASPRIQIIEYDKDSLEEREITDLAELAEHFDSRKVTWINIDGLGDVEALTFLGERFNLHPLALEDVLNTGQRPKVEHTADYVFIVAQMVYQDNSHTICGEQVSLFFGKNFLITVQEEGDYDVFDPVRERIRGGRGSIRKLKADYLAYALLDSIIDHYYPVLEDLGTSIEELEDDLLEKPSREMVMTLHEYKRSLTQMRRFVWPLRDVVNGLLHDPSGFITTPHQGLSARLLRPHRATDGSGGELQGTHLRADGTLSLQRRPAHQRGHARAHGDHLHLHPADLHRRRLRHELRPRDRRPGKNFRSTCRSSIIPTATSD